MKIKNKKVDVLSISRGTMLTITVEAKMPASAT